MATVTGTLADFGIGAIPAAGLELNFWASKPAAVGGSHVYIRSPLPVTFTGGGNWTIELAPNETLNPATYYVGEVSWLNGGNIRAGREFIDMPLYVPIEGGEFAALVEAPSNPAQIWFGPNPPKKATQYTGWYKTDALPDEPNYFEWEN